MIEEKRQKMARLVESVQSESINKQRTECLAKLKSLGAVSSYGSHAYLYHGRDEYGGKKFYVKTRSEMLQEQEKIEEMRHDQGRSNNASISGIYVASEKLARRYAERRHSQNEEIFKEQNLKVNHESKIYKIVASSPDVNVWRIASCTMGEDNAEYKEHSFEIAEVVADYAKTFEFTELYPLPLENIKEEFKDVEKKEYLKLIARLEQAVSKKGDALSEEEVKELSAGISLDEDKIVKLAGNYNVFFYLKTGGIFDSLLWHYCNAPMGKRNKFKKHPVSWELFEAFSSEMGVIGTWTKNDTVSLGDEDVYFIFDTSKVNTEDFVAKQKATHQKWYAGMSQILENCVEEKAFDFLLESSPEETLKFLQECVPQLKDYYSMPAYVQEGFSVGQHTETCLRVLEHSFLDEVPPEMLPFIKMTIAMHDIGKGVARNNGIIDHEEELNITFDILTKTMSEFGMKLEDIELMKYIIGESQKFSDEYFIKGEKNALEEWGESSRKALINCVGLEPTDDQVFALQSIARVLQTCDSGAYTRMGITRDEENGIYYRNANDQFTESMHTPKDLCGNKQVLKDPNHKTL